MEIIEKEQSTIQTENIAKPYKKRSQVPAWFFLVGCASLMLAASNFWERFINNPDLDQEEVRKAQNEAEKINERHRNWVQYILIAEGDGKRPCLKCPHGIPFVTVKHGEVYKYGITTQGYSRYTKAEYSFLGVSFRIEYKGNYTQCKKMEIDKILSYRFLPQSQKEEVKLIRPPGNPVKN